MLIESVENLQNLKATCLAIVAGTEGICSYSWDERFGAVLTQCDSGPSSHLHQQLEEHFPPAWTPRNCSEAPSKTGEIAKALGGIQVGQELFLTESTGDERVLGAAWWPWGGGKRVSVRFFLWPEPEPDSESNRELCDWFGIAKG